MRYDLSRNDFVEEETGSSLPAVIGSDGILSWKELRDKVFSFSKCIDELKIQSGHPVVIYGHKETDFIVSILTLMRKNIPYVPVDVIVPVERLKKIREISGSELLINCLNKEEAGFPTVIQKGECIKRDPSAAYSPIPFDKEDPLRYIIFTSGSTGEPKGVLIAAQALREFVTWTASDFKLKKEDVFINVAPFSFDLSVFELYSFLHLGATLMLNTSLDSKDPVRFFKKIREQNGSVWVSTPSFVYIFLNDPEFNSTHLPTVRAFMFCGEILPRRTVEMLHERFPGSAVFNPYGPTEATCCTTNIDVSPEVLSQYKEIPIGYPKPGSEVHILNEQKNPSLAGEIIIAGNHVAYGYLNRHDLTEEKFFIHNGKRAYRTGDQGFYKDDILFFLGRNDDQVKLHGFRIEMEEITSQIAGVKGVSNAVTIAMRRNGIVKKLVSFIKPKADADKNPLLQEVKNKLSSTLPAYMMPGDILMLEDFPYSTSHKIDKKALEEIYLSHKK